MLIPFVNILGSLISAIGGVISNQQQAKENQKNREWSEYMWNKNNEYNLPVNVMQRYQDAGLNPNLIYSEGAQGAISSYAGNQGTDNAYKNPTQGFKTGILDALNLKNNMKVADSNIETNKTVQSKNLAEAEKASEEAKTQISLQTEKDLQNLITASTMMDTINMAKENLIKLRNENKISEQEYQNKLKEYEALIEKVREAKADADRAEEAVNTQKAQTGLVRQETATSAAMAGYYESGKVANYATAYKSIMEGKYFGEQATTVKETREQIKAINEATLDKLHSETNLNYETANKLVAEANKLNTDAEVSKFVNFVRDKYGTNAATILNNHVGSITRSIKEFGTAVTEATGTNLLKDLKLK